MAAFVVEPLGDFVADGGGADATGIYCVVGIEVEEAGLDFGPIGRVIMASPAQPGCGPEIF